MAAGFIEQGKIFAHPASMHNTPEDRRRADMIMSFAATWEALNITDDGEVIRTRREVESIGSYGCHYYETAYLLRLGRM